MTLKKGGTYQTRIGAIYGKPINIDAVPNAGSTYFNYKGNTSIVLMAAIYTHKRFIYAHVRCNGSVSGGGVWKSDHVIRIPEKFKKSIKYSCYRTFTRKTNCYSKLYGLLTNVKYKNFNIKL